MSTRKPPHTQTGRRHSARRVRALWLGGVAAGFAGAAALVIAATGAASGAQAPRPAGKLARIEALQARLAKEDSQHRAKPSYAAGLRAAKAANPAVPVRHSGIQMMRQGPFAPSSFEVRDFYQGRADGTWLLVYAGSPANAVTGTVTGGALKVYAEPHAGGAITLVGQFRAPAGAGALTIIAASGDRLILRAHEGRTLTFNLATHKFGS